MATMTTTCGPHVSVYFSSCSACIVKKETIDIVKLVPGPSWNEEWTRENLGRTDNPTNLTNVTLVSKDWGHIATSVHSLPSSCFVEKSLVWGLEGGA